MGVLSLMIQGIFLTRALSTPDQASGWVIWGMVLAVVVAAVTCLVISVRRLSKDQ